MEGPSSSVASSYGDSSFYDGRASQQIEWYAEYDTIRPLLQKHLQYSDSILLLGPGTSGLHEELYDSGYRGLTCVDFNSNVLQLWRQRSADAGRSSIKYQLADIVHGLPFEHYPYNAIIDKGTIDCILCRESGEQEAEQAMVHIDNNLKSPAVFMMVSHAPPAVRMPLLKRVAWDSIQVKVIIPTDLKEVADSAEGADVIQEFSAQVPVPEDASFVYLCKKPY